MTPTLNDLFSKGAIADSTISIWTARTAMQAKDFNVPDSPELRTALNLGQARMVPRKSMASIRAAANKFLNILNSMGVDFSTIRGSRFLMDAQVPILIERANAAIAEFNDAVEIFCSIYGQIRDEQEPVLRKALTDLLKGDTDLVDRMMRRIMGEYPSVEAVRGKFGIRLKLFRLSGFATGLGADEAKAEAEQVREMLREMMTQLREEVRERTEIIMEVIKDGRTLRSDTIRSAREVLAKVDAMNLWGDSALYGLTASLRRALDVAEANSGRVENGGILNELDRMRGGISRDIEAAVEEASRRIAGTGGRRLAKLEEV